LDYKITIYLSTLFLLHRLNANDLTENTPTYSSHKEAIEISRQVQKNYLSEEEGAEKLLLYLQDYSNKAGKMASLVQFVQKTAQIEAAALHSARYQRGWSTTETYAIEGKGSEKPQFFLKVFPTDSKDFFPEIFGLALMGTVEGVGAPKVCALAKCTIDDKSYFLLLETPVKGICIQEYFEKVSLAPRDSVERLESMQTLCKAVTACGKGLANLHNYLPLKKEPLPLNAEKLTRECLDHLARLLLDHPESEIAMDKLTAYVNGILKQMSETNHLIGLAYSDVKTIHTFYDALSDTFSLINPHNISLSFNEEGKAQGFVAKDFYKYLLSLELNQYGYYLDRDQKVSRLELLTTEEIEEVKTAFKSSYEENGGALLTPLEEEYLLLDHDLFFIKNNFRDFKEPELTRIREIAALSFARIKLRLQQE
jgi:hypothetical protein